MNLLYFYAASSEDKYYLRLRLVNMAGTDATVQYTDGQGSYNERLHNEMIEEVTPKIHMVNGVPDNYTVTSTEIEANTPLFINGYPQIIAQPTLQKIDYNLYIVKGKGMVHVVNIRGLFS